MRRNEKLVEISRRQFCAFTCVGLGAGVAACTDGGVRPVETGPLGDEPDAPEGDAADGIADAADPIDARPGDPDARPLPDAKPGTPDAAPTPDARPPDAGGGPTCTGTATDCGAASSYSNDSPKYFSSGAFFVVRDSGGLYALSSRCTHEGATLSTQGGDFYCPRHGAQFTYNGDIISGPVFTPLVHYAMCILANGNVGVVKSQTVSSSTRLNA